MFARSLQRPQGRQTRRSINRRTFARGAARSAAMVVWGASVHTAQAQERDATPAPARLTSETAEKLEAILDQHLEETGIPGVAAGVWTTDGGEWLQAKGVSDLETGAPMVATDRVRIASITKTFVATAVLQLVDQGVLSLDDVLETWITGVPNGEAVTVQQLLAMRSGIFSFTEDDAFVDAYNADPLLSFSPQDAVEIAIEHGPDFAPGSDFHYSDTNYILLGLILEEVTGKSADVVIADQILAPLGLTQTSFPTTPAIEAPFTRGYFKEPDSGEIRDVTESNPAVAWTAGAMISTLPDLNVWTQALTSGELLSPESFVALKTWSTIQTKPITVRYGLGILDMGGFEGHNGGIVGYSTFAASRLADGLTIVTATNLSDNEGGSADAIFFDMARLLDPDFLPA